MRKITSTTKVNRQAITAIREGLVSGMEDVARRVLDLGHPYVPDEPPFGKGLVESGDYGVWVDSRKVAGTGNKPKRAVLKQGITLIVGYGFPGRFQSLGTVNIAPNPTWFVEPMNATLPGSASFLKAPVRQKLAGVK